MTEIISTKRVCKIGAGSGIYFEKPWGFKIGDFVQVSIKSADVTKNDESP